MRDKLKYAILFSVLLFIFQQCIRQNPVGNTKQSESQNSEINAAEFQVGTDPESGLRLDENMFLVKGQCTACHSAKLITMNRFTRAGWLDRIKWMQQTQNLWDLGEFEPQILDYLEKYYSPEPQASRRENLKNVEWYELEQK